MTARRDLKSKMAVAATRRAEPETPPAGKTAVRTKPVRITLDLTPADYEALNHWIGSVTMRVNPEPGQRITLSKALRAMISAATTDETVTLVVLDLLRRQTER